jgi:hypothetical protein
MAQHFLLLTKQNMNPQQDIKPQQQDTEAKKESAVFVQTPEGETINVQTDHSLRDATIEEKTGKEAMENTGMKASEEVTSGD